MVQKSRQPGKRYKGQQAGVKCLVPKPPHSERNRKVWNAAQLKKVTSSWTTFFLVEGQGKVFPWLDAEGQTPGATVTFTSCLVAVRRRKWWSGTAGHLSWDFRMTRTGVGKGKFASPGKETEFLGNLVAQSSTVTCLKAKCDRWDTLVYPQSPNPSHGRLLVLERVHTTLREAHSH